MMYISEGIFGPIFKLIAKLKTSFFLFFGQLLSQYFLLMMYIAYVISDDYESHSFSKYFTLKICRWLISVDSSIVTDIKVILGKMKQIFVANLNI